MKFKLDVFLYAAIAGINFAQAYGGVLDWRFWTGIAGSVAVAVKAKLSPSRSEATS